MRRLICAVRLSLTLALLAPAAGAVAAAAPVASAATPRSPAAYERLARDIFAELVGINTTHALGSARAAEALAARFRTAGFPDADLYVGGPRPDKMNLVVRLHGRGRAQPVLFNAHLDVVEARPADWSVDPFRLTEQGGYFYGRGTVDVKNEVAALSADLIRLRAEGYRPDRDIILAFGTDEEAGGDANGVEWLLQQRRALVDAALVINTDATNAVSLNGERQLMTIQTAEKVYATYTLTTHSSGGHSSRPPRNNAVYRLGRALDRLGAYQFPVRLSATTRRYLAATARRVGGARAAAIEGALANPPDPKALDELRDAPLLNAQLHTTCQATLVEGGQSESALPLRARATIQCRLLPEEDPVWVLDTLKRVVDDPAVEVETLVPPEPSPPTELDAALLAKVERITQEMWPGMPVVPIMYPGASDNLYFRRAGLTTFGISGTFKDQADDRAHGTDERIGVTAFYESLEFSYRLMKALAGGR